MKRICRCHGMSESCSVQTCWTQLSDFREIGNYLKIKYTQAQKLDTDKKRMRAGNSADNRGAIVDSFSSSISQAELIYLEDSPDFCRKNSSLGLYGTEGRECQQHGEGLTQWERRSCRRLCHECGLKIEERRTEVMSSCNCKFHWCCKVNCEDCSQVIVKHVCARREAGDSYGFRRRYRGPKWKEMSSSSFSMLQVYMFALLIHVFNVSLHKYSSVYLWILCLVLFKIKDTKISSDCLENFHYLIIPGQHHSVTEYTG